MLAESRCPCICISVRTYMYVRTGSRTCKLIKGPSMACHDYNGLKLRLLCALYSRFQQAKAIDVQEVPYI